MENLLKQILEELQEINKKIPAIESSSENDITGFSITTDTNELLVNVDFKSNEIIEMDGYKVIKHTAKEPVLFKELVQTD